MSAEAFQPAPHFRAEQRQLQRHGIESWPALARLDDGALRRLAADGQASEARLRRLRGQARLIDRVGVSAPEAALLLHAGVPDCEALAEARPEQLLRQLGRFQRQLLGPGVSPPDQATLLGWIRRARGQTGRSPN